MERRLSKVVLMVDLCLDIFTLFRHCLTQQADNRYRIRHAVIGVSVGKCTANKVNLTVFECFYGHLHASLLLIKCLDNSSDVSDIVIRDEIGGVAQ